MQRKLPLYKAKMEFIKKYKDLSRLLDGPYNVPSISSEDDRLTFEKEYDSARDGLVALLTSMGTVSAYSDGDFNVGYITGPSRGIGVVLNNPQFYNKSFLEKIQEYVNSLNENYVIAIDGEHKLGEYFYICISKEFGIQGAAEKKKWLKPFGF